MDHLIKQIVWLCIMIPSCYGVVLRDAKVYVAGHTGLVGSAFVRLLEKQGFSQIVTRTSQELDLRNQRAVDEFFAQERPEYVIVCAAKVGGILANKNAPYDFLYENAIMTLNVLHTAHCYGVKKVLYLGSSCAYPAHYLDPIEESMFLTGSIEKTNRGYALAKVLGVVACEALQEQYQDNCISCMPCNLYDSNQKINLLSSNVLQVLVKKFCDAQHNGDDTVVVWGTGKPRREFLHVDDCAEACLFLLDYYDGKETVNVGIGKDIAILDLAHLIKEIVGYNGSIVFDTSKPDGTQRKVLSIDKIKSLGWEPKRGLRQGIKDMVAAYQKNIKE